MNQTRSPVISRRQKTARPNHHLWNNHGIWWLHCTIHLPDFTKWRLRRNLRTSDVQKARQLRDRLLADKSTDLCERSDETLIVEFLACPRICPTPDDRND
jgi:hypothetical protein